MNTYFSILAQTPPFAGLPPEDIEKLCACLQIRKRLIPKDSFVFRTGDNVCAIYLLLSGKMHIVSEDFWGNQSIIETMPARTLFGEAYVLAAKAQHIVSVVAAEDSEILETTAVHMLETCPNKCACHLRLASTTLGILSKKIVRLTQKLGHIAQRNMREKILSYLSQCAREAKTTDFHIPYSRQELADYLCVDRSALSHELSRLRKDGMLRYQKNHFELLHTSFDDI
jgi:cAMP-binding proteins - catabolite gene activator and regulatory subunit of cAMP-dependent protein kinases